MKFNKPAWVVVLGSLAVMVGCGGGGGGTTSSTPAPGVGVSGTAAVGYPVANGTVSLKCASGATATTTTATNGTWSVSIPSGAAPCIVRVSGGTANGLALTSPLHSILQNAGTVNVTPLTDLIVAKLAGQSPASWFNSVSGSQLAAITPANISAALSVVNSVLASLPGQPALPNGFNPISSSFTANQTDPGDVILDDYATALASAGMTRDEASNAIATGATALTDEVQSVYVIAPNVANAAEFQGTLARRSTGAVTLTIPDSRPGQGTKTLTASNGDGNGWTTGVTSNGGFNGYLSFLGNRVGQVCVPGTYEWDFDDGRRAEYVYVSNELTEVTDFAEIAGKQFTQYVACAHRNITMSNVTAVGFTNTYTESNPVSPSYGVPSVSNVTWSGNVNFPGLYTGPFTPNVKVFRYSAGGTTTYVLVYNYTPSSVHIAISN